VHVLHSLASLLAWPPAHLLACSSKGPAHSSLLSVSYFPVPLLSFSRASSSFRARRRGPPLPVAELSIHHRSPPLKLSCASPTAPLGSLLSPPPGARFSSPSVPRRRWCHKRRRSLCRGRGRGEGQQVTSGHVVLNEGCAAIIGPALDAGELLDD
jgi:hypothetical protein